MWWYPLTFADKNSPLITLPSSWNRLLGDQMKSPKSTLRCRAFCIVRLKVGLQKLHKTCSKEICTVAGIMLNGDFDGHACAMIRIWLGMQFPIWEERSGRGRTSAGFLPSFKVVYCNMICLVGHTYTLCAFYAKKICSSEQKKGGDAIKDFLILALRQYYLRLGSPCQPGFASNFTFWQADLQDRSVFWGGEVCFWHRSACEWAVVISLDNVTVLVDLPWTEWPASK